MAPSSGEEEDSEDNAAVQVKDGKNNSRIIDLTEDPDEYNLRPTTTQLASTLQAIEEHNTKLPPKKKAKETLPEISAPNVNCKTLMHRDPKKNELSYIKKYHNIGSVDEIHTNPINH